MPLCTADRWGKGTCPPVKTTSVSKEMEEKLKKIQEDRDKMDASMYPKTK
jgi:hypothetical protein